MSDFEEILRQEPCCNRKFCFYFQFIIIFVLGIVYYSLNFTLYSTTKCKIGLYNQFCNYEKYPGISLEDSSKLDILVGSYFTTFIINDVIMSLILLQYLFHFLCGMGYHYEDCNNYFISYYMVISCFIEFIFGIMDSTFIIILKRKYEQIAIGGATVANFLGRSSLCFLAILYFFCYFQDLIKCCYCFKSLTREQPYQVQQIQIEQAEQAEQAQNQVRENDVEIILYNNVPVILEYEPQPEDKKVPAILEVQIE